MPVRDPDFVSVLSQVLDERAAAIGVCSPGEVESFDRLTQTAQIRIVTKKSDGTERPVIPNAPVIFPGVYWDLQVGEGGILVIADEDWRTWWRTGEVSEPESIANHELSNAFFIPGLRSSPDSRTLPASAAVLEKPAAGGTVRLGDQAATKAAVHEDFLSDMSTLLSTIDAWGASLQTATGVSYAAVQVQSTAIQALIAAGNYQSPSVKVED